MSDWKQTFWSYDIDTYERCKRMISRIDSLPEQNFNRQFWVDRANEVVLKYPNVGLLTVS